MGSHLKGRKIKPTDADNEKSEFFAVPNVTVAKDQIVALVGMEGAWMKVGLADADSGQMGGAKLFLATSAGLVKGVLDPGSQANLRMVEVGRITGVNTAAGAINDPVYLSNTAGGVSLTPGTIRRVVGWISKVGTTDGEVIFDGSAPPAGIVTGTATIALGTSSISVALDAALAGKTATVSLFQAAEDATALRFRASWTGNNLVIATNANATAATLVAYAIYP